eukprot:jgi/Mesen1/1967/ME000147S01065
MSLSCLNMTPFTQHGMGGGWAHSAYTSYPDGEQSMIFSSERFQTCVPSWTTSNVSSIDMKQRVVWTAQEDKLLKELVAKFGTTKWQACVNATGNKGLWTSEEDMKLLEGHRLHGNRWTEIAKLVPGRTDNAAKNRFMAITKKDGSQPVVPALVLITDGCDRGSDTISGNSGDSPSVHV